MNFQNIQDDKNKLVLTKSQLKAKLQIALIILISNIATYLGASSNEAPAQSKHVLNVIDSNRMLIALKLKAHFIYEKKPLKISLFDKDGNYLHINALVNSLLKENSDKYEVNDFQTYLLDIDKMDLFELAKFQEVELHGFPYIKLKKKKKAKKVVINEVSI